MTIIPNWKEKKESVGILSVIIAHYVLGLGILIIGQRTRNKFEFWGGLVVFLIVLSVLALSFINKVSVSTLIESGLFVLFSLATWVYILIRLIWIAVKKETKLTIV